MENQSHKGDGFSLKFSALLELAASDDLLGFKTAVEEEGLDIDEFGHWYGRKISSNKMGFQERTPLMIAAMFGSRDVLNYIIGSGRVDVNTSSPSDGASVLHCAVAGGSDASGDIVKLLVEASADANSLDAEGNRPIDLISLPCYSFFSSGKRLLELQLIVSNYISSIDPSSLGFVDDEESEGREREILTPRSCKGGSEKKGYPGDPTLPNIKSGVYQTDEFRMYIFKVQTCSRAYAHDWTECPFVHPGESARRRDPTKYHYSCMPCPEFRKGSCRQGDACEYAHGVFESWLHPAQYRTRLCKDETNCRRKVCFFAHKPQELRPVYTSTGSALPSPTSLLADPPTLQITDSRRKSGQKVRNLELDLESVRLERYQRLRQHLADDMQSFSSASSWINPMSSPLTIASASCGMPGELSGLGGVSPTKHDDIFRSAAQSPVLSPIGLQNRNNANHQIHSPIRGSASFEPTKQSEIPVLSLNSPTFGGSFIDQSAMDQHSVIPSSLNDWRSPDGKLNWGINEEELSKLRNFVSSKLKSTAAMNTSLDHSLSKNLSEQAAEFFLEETHSLKSGGKEATPCVLQPMHIEQEQMVA